MTSTLEQLIPTEHLPETDGRLDEFFEHRTVLPADPEQVSLQPILLRFVNHEHLKHHPEVISLIHEYIVMNDAQADDPEHVERELQKTLELIQTVKNLERELELAAQEHETPGALITEACAVENLYKEGQLTRDGILVSTGENYWTRLQNRSERATLEAVLLYLDDALFTLYAALRVTRRRLNQPATTQ